MNTRFAAIALTYTALLVLLTASSCRDDGPPLVCRGDTCPPRDVPPPGDTTDLDAEPQDLPDGCECEEDSDCFSLVCSECMCAEPECDDNRKNGDETDVDCGGGTCFGCQLGEECDENSDCDEGTCPDGVCEER